MYNLESLYEKLFFDIFYSTHYLLLLARAHGSTETGRNLFGFLGKKSLCSQATPGDEQNPWASWSLQSWSMRNVPRPIPHH